MQAQMVYMQQQMHAMQDTITQQQQQMHAQAQQAAAATSSSIAASVVRTPELPKIRQPSSFTGTMGFGVDDWISELQQQFAYYGPRFPDDATKIRFAVAHLTGAAMHWWEHLTEQPKVWTAFVEHLHKRFRPVHAAMLARQKLNKLRQRAGQSVNQYIGVFQNTLTPIDDMGDMDQVHQFVNGLLGPIAAKVWEKHPTDLVTAIDAAVSVEAMHNFGRAALPFGPRSGNTGGAPSSTSNPDAMDLNNINGEEPTEEHAALALITKMANQMSAMEMRLNALGGDRRAPSGKPGNRPPRDRIDGLDAATIKKLQAEGLCFRCKKGGHMKNECPDKPKN
jgi:hypothetical protein